MRHAITAILDEAVDAGPPEEGPWSAGVYEGVAGSVYALRTLGKPVDWPLRAGEGSGFGEGEVGIALVARDRERFQAAARACIDDPWNELLFGAAGALVAARLLGEEDVARAAIGHLWSTWSFDSKVGACLWTQAWDDRSEQFLGFAHGLVGNAYALLSAARFQTLDHQAELMHRVVEALERTALRQGKLVNWLPTLGSPADGIRVQWCHGAPGVVCALAGAPSQPRLDALLLGAGELVWEAGPDTRQRGSLSWNRRQRLGLSQAQPADARPEMARTCAALRHARDRAENGRAGALERRSRARAVPARLHRRRRPLAAPRRPLARQDLGASCGIP